MWTTWKTSRPRRRSPCSGPLAALGTRTATPGAAATSGNPCKTIGIRDPAGANKDPAHKEGGGGGVSPQGGLIGVPGEKAVHCEKRLAHLTQRGGVKAEEVFDDLWGWPRCSPHGFRGWERCGGSIVWISVAVLCYPNPSRSSLKICVFACTLFWKSLTYVVFDLSCFSCMLFKNVLLLLVLFSVVAEPTLFWVGVGCWVVWLRLLLFSH